MGNLDITQRKSLERTTLSDTGGLRHGTERGAAIYSVVALIIGIALCVVAVMTINNWVNAGDLNHIKARGQPSVIPLSEVKKVRKILLQYGRLRRDAQGR